MALIIFRTFVSGLFLFFCSLEADCLEGISQSKSTPPVINVINEVSFQAFRVLNLRKISLGLVQENLR